MLTAASITHAVFSLLFVIGLILLTAYAFRRWQDRGRSPLALGPVLGKTRAAHVSMVEILETRAIDFKRKLVLVRRGDVAHLLLCGEGRDIVVETGIPIPPNDDAPSNPSRLSPDSDAAQ